MEVFEYRKTVRVKRHFRVRLFKEESPPIEGTTANLSQGGAYIKCSSWHSFQTGTPVALTFILPPYFTGQNKTIGLAGEAVITRVDQEKKGIAVELNKPLRGFEQVTVANSDE